MQTPPLPDNEKERLIALRQLKLLDTPTEERFERITRIVKQVFNTEMALITLVDENRQWFKSSQGLDASETPREISFCGHAILGEDIFLIPDATKDERFFDNPVVTGPPNVRFYAGAPLKTSEGYRIGTLCIIDDQPRVLTLEEQLILRDFADCVEEQINSGDPKTHNLFVEKSKRLSDIIVHAQSQFIRETNRREAFNGILENILDLTDSEYGFIGEVLHNENGEPYLKTFSITNIAWNDETRNFYDSNAPRGMEFRNLDSLFGVALRSGHPVIANDPSNDPRRHGLPPGHPALDAFLGIPIHHQDNMVAMMGIANRQYGYDQELIDFLTPLLATLGQLVGASRTKQKQFEIERRLVSVIEGTNVGTWEWNIQTGETVFNQRWAQMLGYTLDELQPTTVNIWKSLSHPDDFKLAMAAIEAHFNNETDFYEMPIRMKHKNGKWVWIHDRGRVMSRTQSNQPLMMFGTHTDINEQKQAELTLKENEQQLREAQALSHIGSWQANLLTGELNWSDEIYRIFGYKPRSFAPSVEAFHAAVHPDDLEKVHESEKAAEVSGNHDVIHRIIRPDGMVRHVHELAQAETDKDGALIRLTGTVQDITDQVEVEQALITARDEAQRANQAKSKFLSSMSHELRTPMNAILGFTQLMELDDNLTTSQKENLQEVYNAGKHLLTLINEVLDLTKVESGKLDISLEAVEIQTLVEESTNLLNNMAGKNNIKIHYHGLEDIYLLADYTRLKQSLLNLLSNAIKYNNANGKVCIYARSASPDRVQICIEDNGPGISAQRINELFQPFNRLGAENSKIEGTGIGLTLTRQIVKLMNGSIGVESEEAKGSTFWIELPLETNPGHRSPLFHPDSATPSNTESNHSSQHSILYIEDNPANLKLVSQIIKKRKDFTLLSTHSAEHGLELAFNSKPNLILLDINLPGMNGYEILQKLRKNTQTESIPIIAVTANAMPDDIKRGKTAGFDDYLTKPIEVTVLLRTLDNYLLDKELIS